MDKRIEHTRKRIRESLVALSIKKPFPEITVKELCLSAGINRSTFYAHYKNTKEILDEIENLAIASRDWYHSLDKGNRQATIELLRAHKDEYSLLLDYGSIKQKLLNKSMASNMKTLAAHGYHPSPDNVMIATILTVLSTLEAFRYMAEHDKVYDMDKILSYMIAISTDRYKELSE